MADQMAPDVTGETGGGVELERQHQRSGVSGVEGSRGGGKGVRCVRGGFLCGWWEGCGGLWRDPEGGKGGRCGWRTEHHGQGHPTESDLNRRFGALVGHVTRRLHIRYYPEEVKHDRRLDD
eukprot:1193762-Prorocentrum_minimum.AAC.3